MGNLSTEFFEESFFPTQSPEVSKELQAPASISGLPKSHRIIPWWNRIPMCSDHGWEYGGHILSPVPIHAQNKDTECMTNRFAAVTLVKYALT